MTSPDLVLLTHEYPFGIASEPFLESELPVLAERFRRIYVLPSHPHPTARPLPGNAELVRMPWLSEPSIAARLAALPSIETARVLRLSAGTWRELLHYRHNARKYTDILGRNLLKLPALEAFVRERGLQEAIFYDFWFENSTLALALCRRRRHIRTAVARGHHSDVFDERWGGLPAPFRQAKASGLDGVFPTSSAAERYLSQRVPAVRGKLHMHRLGVQDPNTTVPDAAPGSPPLILTCALLAPVKRIHLVPEVLSSLDMPVQWLHIGDGPERSRVEAAARQLLPDGTWRLLGQLTNADVIDFYRRRHVQVLLSVSESEGEPVSMMEAQSYGIPVVACDVGGVSEIVGPGTGVLVPKLASPAEIAAALRSALDRRFDAEAIRARWREHYDAQTNYNRFADALLALHESRADTASRTRAASAA